MLDETEWEQIHILFRKAFDAKGTPLNERFQPVSKLYKEITGMAESNPNAIMHHRISLYGDPCGNCGKPLRTPQAAFCAACGWRPN